MPEMDVDEARRRFSGARIARLATVDHEGRPHLVPVVFALSRDKRVDERIPERGDEFGDGFGDEIVMAVDGKPKRSRRLRRLHNIEVNPAVCLLVDAYDEDWNRLWWVRADGGAQIVPPGAPDPEARDEYAAAVAALRRKYGQYGERPPDGPVTVVGVLRWSGWRAGSREDAAGPAG